MMDIFNQPLWWLSTDFGEMILVLFFVTWGLVILNLILVALFLIKKVFSNK